MTTEEAVERAGPVFDPPVGVQRYTTVRDVLYKLPGIEKVVDLGCASGKFVKFLKNLPFVREIACVDLSAECASETAHISRPLAWDFLFKRHQTLSIKVYEGDVAKKDWRLCGFDAVTCIELIEHLEPNVLEMLPQNIFGYIQPKVAIFTTPNCEFNVLFPNLQGFRHWDHKFEWNRNEFHDWCNSIVTQFPDYTVYKVGIGDTDHDRGDIGCCSQMAVFQLKDPSKSAVHRNLATSGNNDEPYTLVREYEYPGRDQQSSATVANGNSDNNGTSLPD